MAVETVETINDMTVACGTTIGLPAVLNITLKDGGTKNIEVIWNQGTPAYNENTPGTYEFEGTLNLPEGVINPGNLKAHVIVIVAAAADPVISTISPLEGNANTQITISGQYFGSGKGEVFLGGLPICRW